MKGVQWACRNATLVIVYDTEGPPLKWYQIVGEDKRFMAVGSVELCIIFCGIVGFVVIPGAIWLFGGFKQEQPSVNLQPIILQTPPQQQQQQQQPQVVYNINVQDSVVQESIVDQRTQP